MPKPAPSKPKIVTFADVLAAAGQRPTPGSKSGPGYSTRFASAMAILIANAFRPRFKGIKPDESGRGVESPSRAVRGLKRLDVNYSTAQAGLLVGISLKSVHVPDAKKTHRYHHNMKRNDEELRVEAAGYHGRQPYAVLVAVVVLPFEACDDDDARPSSFGKWVQYLWPLADRNGPRGDVDRFEEVFIALYDHAKAELRFFDVKEAPPKKKRPPASTLLTLEQFAARMIDAFEKRNSMDFEWADGERDPGTEEEDTAADEDDADPTEPLPKSRSSSSPRSK